MLLCCSLITQLCWTMRLCRGCWYPRKAHRPAEPDAKQAAKAMTQPRSTRRGSRAPSSSAPQPKPQGGKPGGQKNGAAAAAKTGKQAAKQMAALDHLVETTRNALKSGKAICLCVCCMWLRSLAVVEAMMPVATQLCTAQLQISVQAAGDIQGHAQTRHADIHTVCTGQNLWLASCLACSAAN